MPRWAQGIIAAIVVVTLSMIGFTIFWQFGGAKLKVAVVLAALCLGYVMLEGLCLALGEHALDYLFRRSKLDAPKEEPGDGTP